MKKLTKTQQLNLIEGLCLVWENGAKDKPDELIGDIYRIAHLNGTCKNEHLDWHKEGHKLGEELKKYGLTDYNKGK